MAIISTAETAHSALTESLERWLAGGDRNLTDPEIVKLSDASDSTGYSNETLICSISHGAPADRRTEKVVVRMPPVGEGLFENYDMAWQFNLMDRLRRRGHFPAPPCRWLETDPSILGRPFFVMDMVEGQIPPDAPQPYTVAGWVADATDEQRARMWWSTVENLAALAKVDWQQAGLGFIDWPDRTRSRTEQQIDLCDGMRARGGTALPDVDIPVVREAGRWLRMNRPKEETTAVVWGDARLGNIIYRDFRPVAHLDWEWAVIGDPLSDLSYFVLMDLYFRVLGTETPVPQLSGFGSEEETIERFAELTGLPTANFDYYWVLNAYKLYALTPRFGSLMLRLGQMTLEQASAYRTIPTLTPFVMERISRV